MDGFGLMSRMGSGDHEECSEWIKVWKTSNDFCKYRWLLWMYRFAFSTSLSSIFTSIANMNMAASNVKNTVCGRVLSINHRIPISLLHHPLTSVFFFHKLLFSIHTHTWETTNTSKPKLLKSGPGGVARAVRKLPRSRLAFNTSIKYIPACRLVPRHEIWAVHRRAADRLNVSRRP